MSNMKKCIIIFSSFFILFSSCRIAKKNEAKTSFENVIEVSKENDFQIIDKVDDKTENVSNDDSIKSEISKPYTYGWMTIVHEEFITFYADQIEKPLFNRDLLTVWKDKKVIIYSSRLNEDDIIYQIQPDDTVRVFEFLTHDDKDKTLLHVECPDGQTGYICYNHNIFTENDYFFQESIEVDGITRDVYSVSGPVFVKQKEIYALPSENSEIVCELESSPDFNYIEKRADVLAMTDDGEWVKVEIKGFDVVGWVPFNEIGSGFGGPKIWTPYIRMFWNMFDYEM